MEKIRNWTKKYFTLHDIEDLVIGGNCGCCGVWIPDEIFPKDWTWGLCKECMYKEDKIIIIGAEVTGVYFVKDKKKWHAYIHIPGKCIDLGSFKNFIDAVKARYEAELKYDYLKCQTISSAYLYLKERSLL